MPLGRRRIDMTEPSNRQSETERLIHDATDDVRRRQEQNAERQAMAAAATASRGRWPLVALVMATPVLLVMILVNFTGFSLPSLLETRPTPEAARKQADQALASLVAEVEGFRADYNTLPETLVEVGVPPSGTWTYAVTGNGQYRITGTLYGQDVRFDSSLTPRPGNNAQ